MSTVWWLTVLALTALTAFGLGWIGHAEWRLWLRSREPYVREFDLTHTSRGVR